jgi:hypothetical protein
VRGAARLWPHSIHVCQPAEESQLHYPALRRVNPLQPPQRFVERERVYLFFTCFPACQLINIAEREPLLLAAAFGCATRFGMMHQDLPHQPRRNAEEVRAALPVDFALINQEQVDLVDQRGRLKGVVAAFAR